MHFGGIRAQKPLSDITLLYVDIFVFEFAFYK